jgi:hypothetical protein
MPAKNSVGIRPVAKVGGFHIQYSELKRKVL